MLAFQATAQDRAGDGGLGSVEAQRWLFRAARFGEQRARDLIMERRRQQKQHSEL